MTATLFLGIWLASYRLSRIVIKDAILDGPREYFFRWFPPDAEHAKLRMAKLPNGKRYWTGDVTPRRPVSKVGQFFTCAWCVGFYLSGLVILVVSHQHSIPLPVLWWFATSTAVGLTAKVD